MLALVVVPMLPLLMVVIAVMVLMAGSAVWLGELAERVAVRT